MAKGQLTSEKKAELEAQIVKIKEMIDDEISAELSAEDPEEKQACAVRREVYDGEKWTLVRRLARAKIADEFEALAAAAAAPEKI
jgi:hypothetical protein